MRTEEEVVGVPRLPQFLSIFKLIWVETQQAKENQLTTSYKIRFSSNGATWKTYKENKSEKVNIVQDKK